MYDPEIVPTSFFVLVRPKAPLAPLHLVCPKTRGLELLLFTQRCLAEDFRDAGVAAAGDEIVQQLTLRDAARAAGSLIRRGAAVGLWIDPVVPSSGPHAGGVEADALDAERARFHLDRWEWVARYAAPRN
jgi:hypothetical protein